MELTAKEVAESVGLTPNRINQMRQRGVITGVKRGMQFFFHPDVIKIINKRPETRGRPKKIKEDK